MDHSVYFVAISPGIVTPIDDKTPLSSNSTLDHRDSSLVDDGMTSLAAIYLIVKIIEECHAQNAVLEITSKSTFGPINQGDVLEFPRFRGRYMI